MSSMHCRKRRRLVARLIARDGDHCFYCGIQFTPTGKRSRTIDHRVPEAMGGTHDDDNCVLACHKCNHIKGDAAEFEFRASPFLRKRQAMVERMRQGEQVRTDERICAA